MSQSREFTNPPRGSFSNRTIEVSTVVRREHLSDRVDWVAVDKSGKNYHVGAKLVNVLCNPGAEVIVDGYEDQTVDYARISRLCRFTKLPHPLPALPERHLEGTDWHSVQERIHDEYIYHPHYRPFGRFGVELTPSHAALFPIGEVYISTFIQGWRTRMEDEKIERDLQTLLRLHQEGAWGDILAETVLLNSLSLANEGQDRVIPTEHRLVTISLGDQGQIVTRYESSRPYSPFRPSWLDNFSEIEVVTKHDRSLTIVNVNFLLGFD